MNLDRREFLLTLAAGTAFPAMVKASPWRVGLAAVDITPPPGLWMGGYAARREPAQGAAQPLHAKAMAVADAAAWRRRLDDENVYVRRHARLMLDVIAREGRTPPAEPAPLHVLRIGTLALVAISGEVVVDYALGVKRKYGDGTWVAGCTDTVFGYVPSLRVLREGGYEGGDAMLYYGRPGPFADTVETTVTTGIDTLMAATGARTQG